ncbi:hypothetical protein [Pseudoclavibacter helvolus]|uniref:hypothetical protein n=1 Tax=Pseudoclavibacter helvolus TaxID=255205 RepID=UPI003735186F
MTPTAAVTEVAETGSRTNQDRESALLDRVPGGLFGLLSSIVGAALTRTSVPEVS